MNAITISTTPHKIIHIKSTREGTRNLQYSTMASNQRRVHQIEIVLDCILSMLTIPSSVIREEKQRKRNVT